MRRLIFLFLALVGLSTACATESNGVETSPREQNKLFHDNEIEDFASNHGNLRWAIETIGIQNSQLSQCSLLYGEANGYVGLPMLGRIWFEIIDNRNVYEVKSTEFRLRDEIGCGDHNEDKTCFTAMPKGQTYALGKCTCRKRKTLGNDTILHRGYHWDECRFSK